MSDLVPELRAKAEKIDSVVLNRWALTLSECGPVAHLLTQAADEIERLRAEIRADGEQRARLLVQLSGVELKEIYGKDK